MRVISGNFLSLFGLLVRDSCGIPPFPAHQSIRFSIFHIDPMMLPTKTPAPPYQLEEWVHYHDGGIPGRRRILHGTAAQKTFDAVPKIDFTRIYSANLDDRKELAREVGAACRDVGFFYAVNHGVEQRVLDDTFVALERYFALPTDVKMETHNQKAERFRGYEAFLEGRLDPNTRGEKPH